MNHSYIIIWRLSFIINIFTISKLFAKFLVFGRFHACTSILNICIEIWNLEPDFECNLFEKVTCIMCIDKKGGERGEELLCMCVCVCVYIWITRLEFSFFLSLSFLILPLPHPSVLPPGSFSRLLPTLYKRFRLSNSLSQKPVFIKFRGVLISRIFSYFIDLKLWQVLKM